MGTWARWQARRAEEILSAAREDDADEAEIARRRLLDDARREIRDTTRDDERRAGR